jgi:pyruvate dehydrogenase E1 component
MPEGVEEGILKGMYRFRKDEAAGMKVHLFGSGSIMQEVLKAADMLAEFGCSTDIWSVTSYNQLSRDAIATERENLLNPEKPKKNYVESLLQDEKGAFVAASDFMKSQPNGIARWFPNELIALGTDGFGLSESRPTLRDHFEVDARYIAWGALVGLFRQGQLSNTKLEAAREQLNIPREKADPTLF